MQRPLDLVSEVSLPTGTGLRSSVWQAMVHLAAVYLIARLCTPWLLRITHDAIIPLVTGRSPRIDLQFFYSHLFAFSFVPGFVAGFLNAKVLRGGIVRFVWMAPVTVLVFAFVFYAPGVYPTMILESNFREAFHYYFGWQFSIPQYSSYVDLQRNMFENVREVLRGTAQLRVSVPTYVGVAYSLGAWLSLRSSARSAKSPKLHLDFPKVERRI